MPEVDGLVLVGRAAVAAVLGVGGVLHLRERLGVVGEAEVGHPLASAAEIRHQGVVGVEHQARPPVQLCHHLGPAVGQQLELAVAVELVAEEVGEQEQPRPQLARHLGQPGLVHLEQAQLAGLAARVEQSRGHTPGHVGAGPVVHQRAALVLQRRGDHGGGGGLAVGGRDDHRAVVQLPTHPRQGAGRQLEQQAPGRRGAPGASEPAARGAGGPSQSARGTEDHAGTMIRRQRGSTPTVAGVAPIGSPSA